MSLELKSDSEEKEEGFQAEAIDPNYPAYGLARRVASRANWGQRMLSPWVQRQLKSDHSGGGRAIADKYAHTTLSGIHTSSLVNRLQRTVNESTVWQPNVGSINPNLVDRFTNKIINRFPDRTAKHKTPRSEMKAVEVTDLTLVGTGADTRSENDLAERPPELPFTLDEVRQALGSKLGLGQATAAPKQETAPPIQKKASQSSSGQRKANKSQTPAELPFSVAEVRAALEKPHFTRTPSPSTAPKSAADIQRAKQAGVERPRLYSRVEEVPSRGDKGGQTTLGQATPPTSPAEPANIPLPRPSPRRPRPTIQRKVEQPAQAKTSDKPSSTPSAPEKGSDMAEAPEEPSQPPAVEKDKPTVEAAEVTRGPQPTVQRQPESRSRGLRAMEKADESEPHQEAQLSALKAVEKPTKQRQPETSPSSSAEVIEVQQEGHQAVPKVDLAQVGERPITVEKPRSVESTVQRQPEILPPDWPEEVKTGQEKEQGIPEAKAVEVAAKPRVQRQPEVEAAPINISKKVIKPDQRSTHVRTETDKGTVAEKAITEAEAEVVKPIVQRHPEVEMPLLKQPEPAPSLMTEETESSKAEPFQENKQPVVETPVTGVPKLEVATPTVQRQPKVEAAPIKLSKKVEPEQEDEQVRTETDKDTVAEKAIAVAETEVVKPIGQRQLEVEMPLLKQPEPEPPSQVEEVSQKQEDEQSEAAVEMVQRQPEVEMPLQRQPEIPSLKPESKQPLPMTYKADSLPEPGTMAEQDAVTPTQPQTQIAQDMPLGSRATPPIQRTEDSPNADEARLDLSKSIQAKAVSRSHLPLIDLPSSPPTALGQNKSLLQKAILPQNWTDSKGVKGGQAESGADRLLTKQRLLPLSRQSRSVAKSANTIELPLVQPARIETIKYVKRPASPKVSQTSSTSSTTESVQRQAAEQTPVSTVTETVSNNVIVQRDEDEVVETPLSESTPPEADLDKLARQILPLIKRKLAIERERRPIR